MQYGNAADNYRRNQILSASREKLVVLLYDGAIQHLSRAKVALETDNNKHSAQIGISLGKAMAILGELRSTLDMDRGGEIAVNLDRLYDFCLDQIYTSNVERIPTPVEAPIQVLKTLKEGWDAIVPV